MRTLLPRIVKPRANAAVYRNLRPSNESGSIRSQKQRHPGYFMGLPNSPDRMVCAQRVQFFGGSGETRP
jgi:hypothetical protein